MRLSSRIGYVILHGAGGWGVLRFSNVMKRTLLVLLCAACAAAQSPSDPPQLLRIVRNITRSGADPVAVQPYIDAKAAVTVFGMTAISGASETWLIEAHDSFASIEALDHVLGTVTSAGAAFNATVFAPADDVFAPSRTLIALYHPGWSYRPEEAIKLMSRAHYYSIAIYRSPTASDNDFADFVRSRRVGLESLNLDRPDLAYEVVSGAPLGTYILIAPLLSLKVLDDGLTARIASGDIHPRKEKTAAEVAFGREHLLFRVEPKMSYVTEAIAEADPEFWNPKSSKPE